METVGEYQVKGVVGEGGMGVVYEGVQPLIGKRVAIKLLKRHAMEDAREAARLVEEARSVNAIGHRGIVDIFSFGALPDGRQYFVMEFLNGVPLSQHIKQHAPLPVNDVLQILDEILAAVGSAHDQGVVHRDLKPSNIFLVVQGDGSSYVKVLDFGLAKRGLYSQGQVMQTSASHVMGTPEFMAPEQIRAQPVSPRTDLYSIGVLAFEMFTGRLPFENESVAQLVKMHLEVAPVAPSALRANITADVDALVLKLLEKDPAMRPRSCEHVRQQIRFIRSEHQFAAATRLAVAPTTAEPAAPKAPSAPAPAWLQPGAVVDLGRRPSGPKPQVEGPQTRTANGPAPRPKTPPRGSPVATPRSVTPVPGSRAIERDTDRLGPVTPSGVTHSETVRIPRVQVTEPLGPTTLRLKRPGGGGEWLMRAGLIGIGALAMLLVQVYRENGGGVPAPQPLPRAVLKDAAPELPQQRELPDVMGFADEEEQEPAVTQTVAAPITPAEKKAALKAQAKAAPPKVRGLKFVTPETTIGEVVAKRLKKLHVAWAALRKGFPPTEAKGWDLALDQCDHAAKGADKLVAMTCIDEFVRLALEDREP